MSNFIDRPLGVASEYPTMMREELRFLRGFLANPRSVGAIAPSSPALSRACAAQIDPARPGPVLELGPGTGVITREILARGIAPERLMVVEREPDFAKMIAAKFKGVKVIVGDAFDLDKTLAGRVTEPFAAIVSGIPLLNHPKPMREAFVDGALRHLGLGAPLIQFSYGLDRPVSPPPGATVTMAAMVWKSLPPAHVWVYRR
jgi:phosphatidylethanolamine/phosphatidyl-N-methylethanolamine N-methyltransferase